ncbi:RNA polymerase sigma factor [Sphingobacterium yanglingense]|uniref:RNA polymerase sigma-70 factor (ECF subfamily) n=1 Tax=Sphingobacterium yanglingense TaxID=1437280 RepID=A0A4R6WID0_9SPHI|nr:RNA polymerase sigma-70 factor [Sphingobacterium yanglingense]TDQ78101.1 RNA polymerase sigma-70 factor (ECF subfamily) [Sphingobacterium yanglingense]
MANYNRYTDQDLVTLLKQGDQYAYTEIYSRYIKLLYTFALKRLPNEQEVEDILHEIFMSLWNKRAELDESQPIAPYLYNAIRYQVLNIFSRKKITDRYLDSFNQFLLNEYQVDETDHLIRHNELAALIENEIEALPKKMREVFNLSRKVGYSRKQIAEELGISEETVKSHMHHALKILKRKLGTFILLFCL